MDDFAPQEKDTSPLEYSKRKQPKYQLQNRTHFHIILDGIVESPIPALSLAFLLCHPNFYFYKLIKLMSDEFHDR
jgi:hypothetical protein